MVLGLANADFQRAQRCRPNGRALPQMGTGLPFRQDHQTLPPVTPDSVLGLVSACARDDVFLLSNDAIARMRDGVASHSDLRNVMQRAVRCEAAEDGRWRVFGPSLDGVEMSILVAVRGGVVTLL